VYRNHLDLRGWLWSRYTRSVRSSRSGHSTTENPHTTTENRHTTTESVRRSVQGIGDADGAEGAPALVGEVGEDHQVVQVAVAVADVVAQ
jgi:hypothetical protein